MEIPVRQLNCCSGDLAALHLQVSQVAGAAVQLTHRDLHAAEQLHRHLPVSYTHLSAMSTWQQVVMGQKPLSWSQVRCSSAFLRLPGYRVLQSVKKLSLIHIFISTEPRRLVVKPVTWKVCSSTMNRPEMQACATHRMGAEKPVSYTHLDVYKRQVSCWCTAGWTI